MADHESYERYSAERRRQLEEGNFGWWIYRHDAIGCEGRHEDLDGLSLPPGHPFWQRYYPPHEHDCGCYVVGTHVPGGIKRLGGNPDKPIPDWCALPH